MRVIMARSKYLRSIADAMSNMTQKKAIPEGDGFFAYD